MADQKISQLTAATTPLAGTEVLPIVQSGVTKQVSVDNLTAGKAVSASTLTTTSDVTIGRDLKVNRYLQMLDAEGSGSLRTVLRYNADNNLYLTTGTTTGARSVYIQTESTNQLQVDAAGNVTALTGNFVVGTSGKGIDFSATAGTGTSELFNDYEEGTWTPVISDGTNNATMNGSATYTKIGRQVTLTAYISTSSLGSVTGNIRVTGFPFTVGNGNQFRGGGVANYGTLLNITAGQIVSILPVGNNTYGAIYLWDSNAGVTDMQASEWSSDGNIFCVITYFV